MTLTEFYIEVEGSYQDALSRLMNDRLITKFVLKFKNDPSFETLKAALAEDRIDDAFAAAHTLKGVALNLAFTKLGTLAAALTDFLRPQNRTAYVPETARAMFDEVALAYAQTTDAIDRFAASL